LIFNKSYVKNNLATTCFRSAGGLFCTPGTPGGLRDKFFELTRSNITAVKQQGGIIMGKTSTRECQRPSLKRSLAALAAVAVSLWVTTAVADGDDVLPLCQALQVPVSLVEVPGASLYGELCVPATGTPSAVQLLVHGATYNRYYSDWPYRPDFYSYVRQMVGAGYATLNIERLGYGRSTHPLSTLVTLANETEALRQVVDKLRSGEIGGRQFSRVIWVGHSLGTLYGWLEASVSQNIDAFVLTGLLHSVKASWLALANQSAYAAVLDASFATSGLDPGYLTFKPGTRSPLFYWTPTAEPNVIALDERLKDTVSGTEFGAAVPLFNSPPPQTAPSRAIKSCAKKMV
jgi:hypothetical protein